MLASMTGFVKHETQSQYGVISIEIRCVNHRYFDPHFYLPEQLSGLEMALRNCLNQQVQRGRCEVRLRFIPSSAATRFSINKEYTEYLLQQLYTLSRMSVLQTMHCDILALLQFPGVIQVAHDADGMIEEFVLSIFNAAVERLVDDRRREGAHIKQHLEQRLMQIDESLSIMIQRVPVLLPTLKARLKQTLQTVSHELDETRLEQEMLYLANKTDIQEELDRFQTHLHGFKMAIEKGGQVGRRLDFLLQELQREINTLGNKAGDKLVSQQVVDIKVLIEQLREQVQNVE